MSTLLVPQPYIDDAQCYWCKIPSGYINFAILAALIDVANGDPVPTDPDELIAEARCLESCIPPGMAPYAILAAISGITTGGGGTGGPGVVGAGSPEGVVTAPAGTSYLDTNSNGFYFKASGAGNTGWVLIVGP